MYATDAYKDAAAQGGADIVDKFILVDVQEEISHGEDPSLPLNEQIGDAETETDAVVTETGTWRPESDIEFSVGEGETVSGWRGLDENNNIVCGADLPEETFTNAGAYTLEAETTGMVHELGEAE